MTKTPESNLGWTIETYAAHNEALRAANEKFETERDRRYSEVKLAEEKAIKVKEKADDNALALAREIQTYKDEKANELREQIGSERHLYATKADVASLEDKLQVTMKPVLEYIASNQGSDVANRRTRVQTNWSIGTVITLAGMVMMAGLSLLGLVLTSVGLIATLIYFLVGK